MPISDQEFAVEKNRLAKTLTIIRKKISALGAELYSDQEKVLEFKKFLWDSHTQMDPAEMKTMMSNNDVEISIMMNRGAYLQKLYRVQNKPYFGSIIFHNKEDGKQTIYIGITHVEDDLEYYVHDWRSPICSMFYDYELGKSSYEAPNGIIEGVIERKRQYTIEDAQLIHVFDNEINIDDELLQKVLATESTDKMKNIVNTIQKEQNQVIRNIKDKNLIVQGIAGSGKTSVALHRIAFLLYKIKELSSNHVLIFSPNKVFSEYISNVLPELGEENTKETSIHGFLLSYLKEFKQIESFSSFIERYYKKKTTCYELTYYKQNDEIIKDISNYINKIVKDCQFTADLITKDFTMTKEELNELLRNRYQHFPVFKRIEVIAEKICDWYYLGKLGKKRSLMKMLFENLSLKKDYIAIYNQFFKSTFCKIPVKDELQVINKKQIAYEDASLFVYMKQLLEGVDYNTDIKQVVIDEAQDYTKLQYMLLISIFKNASFTILGDVNQTINPYYKYDSLEVISDLLPQTKYLELLKAYRSSEEIIEYTNKILGIKHVSAIRRSNQKKVIIRNTYENLKISLLRDIKELQIEHKSIAIITKTEEETENIYQLLHKEIAIVPISQEKGEYHRSLVVLPAYIAKGLEFDAVIVYSDPYKPYEKQEKYLFYVACTRAQHQLIVYNQSALG